MKSAVRARALLGAAALSVCLVLGCTSSPGAASAADAASPEVLREADIVYVTRGDTKLLLDIARPAKQVGPGPAVIFLHGADTLTETKSEHGPIIWMAAKRGYVGVAVTYRLPDSPGGGNPVPFPAQLYDVKAAIRWLRANAERYMIDPDRIGLVGWGFGGWVALLAAFTEPSDGLEGEGGAAGQSSKVQVAVAAGAPVDWRMRSRRPEYRASDLVQRTFAGWLGGTAEQVPENWRAADPTTYLGAWDTPVLAIYGGGDSVVIPEEGRYLGEAMLAARAAHSFLVLPKANRSFLELARIQSDYPMWSFLDGYLKAK